MCFYCILGLLFIFYMFICCILPIQLLGCHTEINACHFQCSTVSLNLCTEYLNTVTCKTPVLLQIKNQIVGHMEHLSVSSYRRVANISEQYNFWPTILMNMRTRSSATAKSTARPSCLVGVLYDIYRETSNRSTANQPLVRNWP